MTGLGFVDAADKSYPKDPEPSCGLDKVGDPYHTSIVLELDGTTPEELRDEGTRLLGAEYTSVSGYPAVVLPGERDTDSDEVVDSVMCALYVEVSDTQGFSVGALEMPAGSDPCGKMKDIAVLVIANVKGDR